MHSLKGRIFASLTLMLLRVAAPAAAAAKEVGCLFLTPQERQDLDRRRATIRTEEEAPQISEGPLMLDGQVQRSSGRTTTWINGVPQDDRHSGLDPAQLTVFSNEVEPGVSLTTDQIYECTSGAVRNNLRGGEITVWRSSRQAQTVARRDHTGKSPAPAR